MRVVLWILIPVLLYTAPAGAEEKKKPVADTPPFYKSQPPVSNLLNSNIPDSGPFI